MFLLQILNSGNSMTTEDIVQRIIHHRLEFEERNTKKEQKENAIMKSLKKTNGNVTNGETNGKHKQNGESEIENDST